MCSAGFEYVLRINMQHKSSPTLAVLCMCLGEPLATLAIMTHLFERGDYTLHQAPFAKFHFGTSCFQLSMARLSSDGLVSGNGSRSWCCGASLDMSVQGKNMLHVKQIYSCRLVLLSCCALGCCHSCGSEILHPEMKAPRWLKHLHSKGSPSSFSENHGRNRYKFRFR